MSNEEQNVQPIQLPHLPVKHEEWIAYAAARPNTSMTELIEPYKEYDSKLREIFAQQPDHPAITKSNIVSVFGGREEDVKIRARNLAAESPAEKQCYIMPLPKDERRANGSHAVVQSLKEFQTNFQLFSESALVDMDWSNVVVAGSAVVTSLLPVPKEHSQSKRALREYYHQQLAPASDVDLFLYGLTEEQAIEKIKQIEQRIRDSILTETTTIRTKNAITIASQYPTRHVQIVLRIYRSISEILTGFDVDCSCAAYDGEQVYASPRALAAYMTQINTIDLTRRSPSYENRLSKYSRRGFEVYWPLLDRSRVDPTLFERSFGRTLGLARLLVLEKLPKNTDREAYVDQRRLERGRPAINRMMNRKLWGNMKDDHEDEVAEWVETDEVSDYHTFTIPYGPKYHARKIERLLYAKDLLLNAEWNRPKERETTLHRHPAFFGYAEDVIGDCCGSCPKPESDEDKEIAEEESKAYVSGLLTFIKDDPGRQAIGSFNPLTDDDWTEMAYVGNTARLCQAIVEGDLEHVQDWLSQEGADPNTRDYTGRMPLHLAVISSTPEIVQCLIDAGARITARIFDGKTALHLAAMRGEVAMVRSIMIKSEANEEKEAEKEAAKKKSTVTADGEDQDMVDIEQGIRSSQVLDDGDGSEANNESEDDDIDMLDDDSENMDATTENSMVKIDHKQAPKHEALPEDDDEDEPDILDVNVFAWDAPVSALHLAIANGHIEVVKALVQDFGADVLLPIKLLHDYNKSARAAILPLVLALQLPVESAKEMTKLLMSLGASPAQADTEHITALHYFTAHGNDLLKTMIQTDQPAAKRAIGHLSMSGYQYNPNTSSALHSAIENGDNDAVDTLLMLGASPQIDFSTYITSFKSKWDVTGNPEDNKKQFQQSFVQPVFTAVQHEFPSIVLKLVDAGADVNSINTEAWKAVTGGYPCANGPQSLLDNVRRSSQGLKDFLSPSKTDAPRNLYGKQFPPIPLQEEESEYVQNSTPGSYTHWSILQQLSDAKQKYKNDLKSYEEWKSSQEDPEGTAEKQIAVKALLSEFESLEGSLVEKGAKTFKELYPDVKVHEDNYNYNYRGYEPEPPKPWSPTLSFKRPDLTDEQRDGYLKLFQACWDADLSTIKQLTLAIWNETQSPLRIAIQDSIGFSPFSIAILRKHYDVARAILEIAHAQYAPAEKPGVSKHSIMQEDEDEDSENGRDHDFMIYTELVDDRFTVDNIGEVQNTVQSDVTPLTLISWDCQVTRFLSEENSDDETYNPLLSKLFDYQSRNWSRRKSTGGRAPRKVMKDAINGRTYPVRQTPSQEYIQDIAKPGNLFQLAIYLEDAELLHFLLAMGEDYTTKKGQKLRASPGSKFFSFNDGDFQYAIRLGRVQLLEEIIQRTGAGIPLDDLVKKSGIEVVEKSEYYQGLTVHGEKRADWANEGRATRCDSLQEQHPPLLHAARLSSLQSVDWFSGDASFRCYSEFANNHRDDERIQNLAKSKGGLEKSISKWLQLRSHLLLHCVILGKPTDQSHNLLRHLCKTQPTLLEHRSASGLTPLHLACSLHRKEAMEILLEAGADQTCRDKNSNNILHAMLNDTSFAMDEEGLAKYSQLISLLDPRLLPSLFTERTTEQPGAATPLARWMYMWIRPDNHYYERDIKDRYRFVQKHLELSKGEDLSLVNAEGDTPVHAAARYKADEVLRVMLECRPEVLQRENATGRTPYEIVKDAFLAEEVFSDPPAPFNEGNSYSSRMRIQRRRNHSGQISIVNKQPQEFINTCKDERSSIEKVWQVCKEFASKTEGTMRKLVTLVEANEVARRLTSQNSSKDLDEDDAQGEEEGNEEKEELDDDNEENDTTGDEVQVWLSMARYA